jgi:hypothetical protein
MRTLEEALPEGVRSDDGVGFGHELGGLRVSDPAQNAELAGHARLLS